MNGMSFQGTILGTHFFFLPMVGLNTEGIGVTNAGVDLATDYRYTKYQLNHPIQQSSWGS